MNDTTLIRITVGGIDYINANLGVTIPLIIIYFLQLVLGLFGNLLIIFIILSTKDLQTVTNMLILNLAITDGLLCVSNSVSSITSLFNESTYFENHKIFCSIFSSTFIILSTNKAFNEILLAVNRLVNICYKRHLKKLFTQTRTLLCCLSLWLIAIVFDIPNHFVFGDYYNEKTFSCVMNWIKNREYAFIYAFVLVLLPAIFVFACYVKIFHYVHKTRRNLVTHENDTRQREKSYRLANSLFASFVIFLIFITPFTLTLLFDWSVVVSTWFYIYTLAIGQLHSVVTPFLYLKVNPVFRKAYVNLMVRIRITRNKEATRGQ